MADPFLVSVGERIKDLREEKGLTRPELAKAAKTSHVTIGSIEEGATATNLAILSRIARALGTEPWDLLKPQDKRALAPKRLHELIGKLLQLDKASADHFIGVFLNVLRGPDPVESNVKTDDPPKKVSKN